MYFYIFTIEAPFIAKLDFDKNCQVYKFTARRSTDRVNDRRQDHRKISVRRSQGSQNIHLHVIVSKGFELYRAKVDMYLLPEYSSSMRTCDIEVDPGPRGRRMTRSDFIRRIYCCSMRSVFVEDAKMDVGLRHPFSDDGPPLFMYVWY